MKFKYIFKWVLLSVTLILMVLYTSFRKIWKYEKSNKYNDEIKQNHTTKILRFLVHLNKTSPDLCKFATQSYSNLS